jgi:hypothetical protein
LLTPILDMALSIDQLLLPSVAILLVVIIYFTFLRKIRPDSPRVRRRERSLNPETPQATQIETAESEGETEKSVKAEEAASLPKRPRIIENKVEKESITKALKAETPEGRDEPRKKGFLSRATRKSKPTPVLENDRSDNGEVPFCPKYLGYLGTLPKGSPYPDQCLGCRKVVTCIGLQRGKEIESIYLEDKEVASRQK